MHGAWLFCGIRDLSRQGSNPCLLHWQASSLPLSHQGSPTLNFLTTYSRCSVHRHWIILPTKQVEGMDALLLFGGKKTMNQMLVMPNWSLVSAIKAQEFDLPMISSLTIKYELPVSLWLMVGTLGSYTPSFKSLLHHLVGLPWWLRW